MARRDKRDRRGRRRPVVSAGRRAQHHVERGVAGDIGKTATFVDTGGDGDDKILARHHKEALSFRAEPADQSNSRLSIATRPRHHR